MEPYKGEERRDLSTRPHNVYICGVTGMLYDRETELPLRHVHGTRDLSKDDYVEGVFKTDGIKVDSRGNPILNTTAYSIEGFIRGIIIEHEGSIKRSTIDRFVTLIKKRIDVANKNIDKLNAKLSPEKRHPHFDYDEMYTRLKKVYDLEQEQAARREQREQALTGDAPMPTDIDYARGG